MTNAATKNGSNGVHPDAAITPEHDLLWDSLSPRVVTELEKPLDPSLVSQRKGRAGRTLPVHRGTHRHRPGERDIRSRRLGI